jgi:myo-inositol-1(or 4)-monophosphatase
MEKSLNSLGQILTSCGDYILNLSHGRRDIDFSTKDLNSLVTEFDIASENFLIDKLYQLIPEATFLTEENTVTANKSGLYWIIDPIDGTTNFIHKIPFWGISVALCKEGQIVMGAVADISNHAIYAAELSKGAFKNNVKIGVSTRSKLEDSLIATGFPYYDFGKTDAYLTVLQYFMEHTRGIRRCGAASLDLCYTATGSFDGFFEYGLSSWDVAAGALIVQEAGGVILDFSRGNNWLFGKEIIACTPNIAEEFTSIIAGAFK